MKNKKLILFFLSFAIISLSLFIGVSFYEYEADDSKNENKKEPIAPGLFEVVSTYERYLELISSEENHMIVIGRDTCGACNRYKPNIESASENLGLDIYYINLTLMSTEDYRSIFENNINIPAKCTKSGTENHLKDGFGTPLTLFVHEGESYDCIRGYHSYEDLEILLKDIDY